MAFEASQKYKEGKFIIEKVYVLYRRAVGSMARCRVETSGQINE